MRPVLTIGLVAAAFVVTASNSVSAAAWQSIGPDGGQFDGFAQSYSSPDRMYALPIRDGVWRSDDRVLSFI